MKKLEYEPVSRSLELDLESLSLVENPNVREVALRAKRLKDRMKRDPSYEIQGTYSEAYSGES